MQISWMIRVILLGNSKWYFFISKCHLGSQFFCVFWMCVWCMSNWNNFCRFFWILCGNLCHVYYMFVGNFIFVSYPFHIFNNGFPIVFTFANTRLIIGYCFLGRFLTGCWLFSLFFFFHLCQCQVVLFTGLLVFLNLNLCNLHLKNVYHKQESFVLWVQGTIKIELCRFAKFVLNNSFFSRKDRSKAVQILNNDLRVFRDINPGVYRQITELVILDDFRWFFSLCIFYCLLEYFVLPVRSNLSFWLYM